MNYEPEPLDTSSIDLSTDIIKLAEILAINVHEVWAQKRIAEGWKYGPERNASLKEHECLVPYNELPEGEKDYDRKIVMETLKAIVKLGYKIEKAE